LPLGDGEAAVANWFGAAIGHATPVGAFPADAAGLYDTIGNTWEWLANIPRPKRGEHPHIVAGIGFNASSQAAIAYVEVRQETSLRFQSVGFRCVLSNTPAVTFNESSKYRRR